MQRPSLDEQHVETQSSEQRAQLEHARILLATAEQ